MAKTIEISRDENDRMETLYKASTEGCVETLNSLMEEDPLTLSQISANPFDKTPLHISASLGHLNFTRQLVSRKPKLAEELDLLKRSPLHLASAEGHSEIVETLVEANKGMCLVGDEDGKIPLHYAAMRGRVEVIKMLIRVEPKSIQEKLIEGETVLHLCVQYNQLEALKVLVRSVDDEKKNEFLNSQDQCGNTILHLAVKLKQIQTIKFLVSIPEMIRGANSILNESRFTAFEMVEHLPKDSKSVKIQDIIQKSKSAGSGWKCWWSKFIRYMQSCNVDWIKDRSGALMIVATVIATMTFQTALNPPGGVWQQNQNISLDGKFDCTPEKICLTGTAVLGNMNLKGDQFIKFLAYDTIAFLASLTLIFLLISGFSVEYKPCMWLFDLALCTAVTFTALAFMEGVYMVVPIKIKKLMYLIYAGVFSSWIGLIGMVILLHTIRLVLWAVKKLQTKLNKAKSSGNHNQNTSPTAHV